MQPGSPSAFATHPNSQPRSQPPQGVARPPVQQSIPHLNPPPFTGQGSAPHLSTPPVGIHPAVLQDLQPSAASSYPLLTTVSSGISVGSAEQPASINAGANYLAQPPQQQQAPAHYSTTALPQNFGSQQPQQPTRIGLCC